MAQTDTFANRLMEAVRAKGKPFDLYRLVINFQYFFLEISVDNSAKSVLTDTTISPSVRRVNVIHWAR